MMLGIDPKVDYAFKWLFGNQKNTSILIHLLHAILNPAPDEQIVEIQILNPINDKMALDEKLSILDIKVRDQLGRQFNIEMQMLATATLKQRILYYWGKLYTEQLQVEDTENRCGSGLRLIETDHFHLFCGWGVVSRGAGISSLVSVDIPSKWHCAD
jgi:predicted transposase/invertase (TIGR01784 family)